MTEASPIRFNAAELAQVTAGEMAALTRFLERRDGLPWPTRRELADKLSAPLRKRLESPRAGPIAETEVWLEALQSAWVARRQRW